jgi:hypothetical protein
MNSTKRCTLDGSPIYRPTKWPFETVEGRYYIIQTECFTDTGVNIDDKFIESHYIGEDGEDTPSASDAKAFDTNEEAIKYITKHNMQFATGEDGNVYPRVLKVRTSCIVEGIAFESIIREIEGNENLEEVA